MWRRSSTLFATLVALTVGFIASASAETDAERLAARTAAQAGDKAMAEERYADALELFVRVEAAHHAPTLVLRIARAHAKLGQFVKSREVYLRVKREVIDESAPAAFKKAREDANAELPEVEAQIALVTLEVVGPPRDALRLKLDDVALPNAVVGLPYPVDPSTHTIIAEADAFESNVIEFTVERGGSATVNIVLQPAPNVSPTTNTQHKSSQASARPLVKDRGIDASASSTNWLRIGAYAGFGIGAFGLGLAGYYQLESNARDADAEKQYQRCLSASRGDTCTNATLANNVFAFEKDAEGAHEKALIFAAVGGVGVAAGVVLFFVSADDDAEESAWSPYFDGQQVGLAGRF